MAAQKPFPRRKYAILYTIAPITAVIIAVLMPSFSPNNLVTVYIMILEIITPITKLTNPYKEFTKCSLGIGSRLS